MEMTQEQQEQELMRLNAQLDEQISAVEQQADSMLQKQHRLASTHERLITHNERYSGSPDASGDNQSRSDDYSGPGTTPTKKNMKSAATGAGVMSPRVQKAIRASAARAGGDREAAEKRNLNQQNQVRVQKLEIAQLNQEVNMLQNEIRKLNREQKRVQANHNAVAKNGNELKRTLAKTTKELSDSKALCQKLRTKNKDLDVQVSQLRRDLREQSKDTQGLQSQQKSGDLRLNRALAEVARLKEKLLKQKESATDSKGEKEERLQKQEKEIRLLERQRAELLGAFKKQLRLIDILKRQKMHIEAARLLSFTEEEFMKAIDWS